MKGTLALITLGALATWPLAVHAQPKLTADEVVAKMVAADPYGTAGAETTARFIVQDSKGTKRELAYQARSRKYQEKPQLSKMLVRFTAPADMAGMGFLQIQKSGADSDRWLWLPELKRSRRIGGSGRSQSFMGTDFSYGDMDQAELRESKSTFLAPVKLGGFDCYHVEVVPTSKGALYSKLELWIRKDNFLPLRQLSYGANGAVAKELTAQEIKRLSGHWYLTKATLKNSVSGGSTQMILDSAVPRNDIPDSDFTARALEK